MGVRGPGGVLGRGRPRRRASKAPARPKGEGQGRAREASGSPKGGAPPCGPRQVAAGWGSSHGRWGSQAAEVGGEPGGPAAAAAAQRPSHGVRRLTAQAMCCERHLVGCQGMGARRAGPGLGPGWRGAGPGPSRPTLGFSRPALGPGRPGPWPPRLPGSRACPSSPVHGRACPRGTAILRRPACLGLGHAQPTAGSWQALGPSCRSMGQRLATRGTGLGLDGVGRGGDGRQGSRPWCVGVWCRRDGAPEHSKEPHREPKGPGPRPPPRPLQPHPRPAGLSREGPTWPEAGKMLLGAQGLPGTVLAAACVLPAAPEGRGVRPLGGAPRACERRGAPGKPRCSKQEVAGGGPRPGREGSPQFHDVLARAPGRKPTRGLGGSPRAWLGPGSQGAAEGRVQTMAGHGSHHTPPPRPPWPPRSPPPPLALAGPGRGTALGPPIHGGPRRP